MSITIDLKLETETRVKSQALRNGIKFEDYVNELIEEASERRERMGKMPEATLDEILAPIRKSFQESELSEDEWLELFENEREAMWQEKHGAK